MPIVLPLFGPTTKIKDIKGQAKISKGRKRPENSVTAAKVYWSLLRTLQYLTFKSRTAQNFFQALFSQLVHQYS